MWDDEEIDDNETAVTRSEIEAAQCMVDGDLYTWADRMAGEVIMKVRWDYDREIAIVDAGFHGRSTPDAQVWALDYVSRDETDWLAFVAEHAGEDG